MLANLESYNYFRKICESVVDVKNAQKSMEERDRIIRECVEHENTPEYENYLAGVICAYWFLIDYYYRKDISQPVEDYQAWVIEGIMKGLKYRGWLDPKQKISKEECSAAKVINRCIYSVILNHLTTSKRKCRVANRNCISIDNFISENGDTFGDLDLTHEEPTMIHPAKNLIQKYADSGKLFDAVVIDSVCNGAEFTSEGKISFKKLTNDISNLNSQYINYFLSTYSDVKRVDMETLCAEITNLANSSRKNKTLLINRIKDVLRQARRDVEVRSLCC